MRQTGLFLILLATLGVAFFLATDARFAPEWATRVGWSANMVDATTDSLSGTLIGLLGSAGVLAIGIWLTVRKSI